jgi:Xaa-Pro aminopeptidase
MQEERVSEHFDAQKLHEAQDKTWALVYELKNCITPGMSEIEATEIYKDLQLKSGASKYWHPPKIRFGVNSTKAFRDVSVPDVRLKENDIFFLDLGPIYDGYEGDAGKTFLLGHLPEGEKIIKAGEEIFKSIADRFRSQGATGVELYAYAEKLAKKAGYSLVDDGARGHRIGDFPHAVYFRGNLKTLEKQVAPDRWILEVQLRHLSEPIGAFFEDILR